MKKNLLIVALSLATILSVSAQEKATKVFIRQAGDIALGIDATPFLEYAGNAFNTSKNDAPTFGDWTITGRYFLTEESALRLKLAVDFRTVTNKTLVNDVTSDATPPAKVENSTCKKNSDIILGVGYERRRGEGRLQGFYGVDVFLATNNGSGSTTYEYGNQITKNYPISRTTEQKNATSLGFGLAGFVGVEYFITTNISLRGELSLGLAFQPAAKGKTTTESWDSVNERIKTETTEQYSVSGKTNLSTAGSGIFLSFYF